MLTHICLSDLHAGAMTSLLTAFDDSDETAPRPVYGPPSDVTTAFAGALDHFLGSAGATPQLILLGDVLDLQFSDTEDAFRSALGFLSALKKSGRLQDDVLATAGNHDHSLWTDARLSLQAAQFRCDPHAPGFRAATKAFIRERDVESRLLTALLNEAKFTGLDFRYPNIGFDDGKDRMVLLHHGHFIETPYRLMSALKDALSGVPRQHLSVDTLSAENAGWIDFFWSTLGDAASLGRGAEAIYQNLLTTTGFRKLSQSLAGILAKELSGMLPMSGNISFQEMLHAMSRTGLDVTLGRYRDSERYAVVDALTTDGVEGLRWYLEGPAALQIVSEELSIRPDTTFIFGHTHKPFSRRVVAKPFPTPVKVFNSGGWTLNGPRLDNAEGAALLLIDDKLNVASLRLFTTPENGCVRTPYVEILGDGSEGESFKNEIETWVEASIEAWERLAETVKRAYDIRQRFLLNLTRTDDFADLRREAAE